MQVAQRSRRHTIWRLRAGRHILGGQWSAVESRNLYQKLTEGSQQMSGSTVITLDASEGSEAPNLVQCCYISGEYNGRPGASLAQFVSIIDRGIRADIRVNGDKAWWFAHLSVFHIKCETWSWILQTWCQPDGGLYVALKTWCWGSAVMCCL